MSDASELRRLQGWVHAVITHPDGAAAGTASDAARRHLDVPADELDTVVRPSSRLTAEQRLDLYTRSYRLRLRDALRASYPGLRHMLGDELFDGFALDYVRARPSRSWSLLQLGEGLAGHLAATRPDADGPDEAWPDLMIDLAQLERTFTEVYEGPGAEGEWLPAADDLPAHPDVAWLAATVAPVPCLRLARSSFPAGPYLSAVRRGEKPPLPEPAESFVAVSRRDYSVTLTSLDAAQHALLAALLGGARLAAAAAAAGLDDAEAWRLVRRWADAGFFQALSPRAPFPQHPTIEEAVTP